MTEVDDDEDTGNVSDDAPTVPDDNGNDENLDQVFQDQDWVPIGYIPGRKYKKLLMHSNHRLSKLSSLRK